MPTNLILPSPPAAPAVPAPHEMALRARWLHSLRRDEREALHALPLRAVERAFEAWVEGQRREGTVPAV